MIGVANDGSTPLIVAKRTGLPYWRPCQLRNDSLGKHYRQQVLGRDGWRCYLCRKPIDPTLAWPHERAATVDHVTPRSAGGLNGIANLRAAHWACNRDKGDRLLDWWESA